AFLLSILILERRGSKKNVFLSGLLFGAEISTKMWTLAYVPAILLYIIFLHKEQKLKENVRYVLLFVLSFLCIAGLWYLRAYTITGNPIYPLFSNLDSSGHSNYFGFNWRMFTFANLVVLSPLFFLSILFSLRYFKDVIKKIRFAPLSFFVLILLCEQLFIQVDLGRYLVTWFTISLLIVSAGIEVFIKKSIFAKYLFIVGFCMIFCYYLVNSFFMLPYGFGWADQNKFLSRIMERNNASYYDFDHLFNKHITSTDLVAIYALSYYYYADFSYKDTNY